MYCGIARMTINPEAGHHLAGYGSDYPNEGIHDDLAVTALFVSSAGQEAMLLSYDLIGMCRPFVEEIRTAVAQAAAIPRARVFLANTHVHTGPEVRSEMDRKPRPAKMLRPDYNARLVAWSVGAAREARSQAEECELVYNSVPVRENMNRRYRFADRTHRFIPYAKSLAGLSDEFVDPELGIVGFRRKGHANKFQAVVTHYTAHPLCVGNSSYLVSADYQGYLRRTVEETFGGALCLTLTGAAGDHHPLLPESGFAQAEKMGRSLGTQAICRLFDAAGVGDEEGVRAAYEEIRLPAREGPPFETAFSLLGIGPILFAGMPGELVGMLGAQIKWSSPFLKSYPLLNATDNINYIPAANQFLWGGYEVTSSRIAPGAGETLVQAVLAAANRLLAAAPLRLPDVRQWNQP